MQQHSTSLSESNSALATLLVKDDSRGRENAAVQDPANKVADSVQSRTTTGQETGGLLSSSVVQQASTFYKTAESSASSMHGPASPVPGCTRAASTADVPRQQGSAPTVGGTGLMPAQPSNPDHLIASCPAADEGYAGLLDDTQLHISPFAAIEEASSSDGSPSAPSAAVAGSMSTPKAGISDRSSPAVHFALPHLPESRHSKGLQQLWNSMAHTPLMVPSPCSMTGKQSKQGRRQSEEQGHQPVLVSEMSTAAEGTSQSSSMRGSAAPEVTEGPTAHPAGLMSTPMGGAENPYRCVLAAFVCGVHEAVIYEM